MNLSQKSRNRLIKSIFIGLVLISMLFIVWFQNSFSKTNPYDKNWVYWDDSLSISKIALELSSDKNFYLTMKITKWRLKLAEAWRTNADKFLAKSDTLSFARDFITMAPGFQQFHESIANWILYNNGISSPIKKEYADILYDSILNNKLLLDDTTSQDSKQFKESFGKELAYCKNEYPLSKKLWKVYFALWTYEKMTEQNDSKAFCWFLYSWYWTDIEWWYDWMISSTTTIKGSVFNEDYIMDFGKRLKEYFSKKSLQEFKNTQWKDSVLIYDGEKLHKRIVRINKSILDARNSKIITESIWAKQQ